MIKILLTFCLLAAGKAPTLFAQLPNIPVQKETLRQNREKLYHRILNQSIVQNLSLPLADSTYENWQTAFYSISFIRYKNPWIENRIRMAFADIQSQNIEFQQALLTMIYDMFPQRFEQEVLQLLQLTTDAKTFALCSEYLLQYNRQTHRRAIAEKTYLLLQQDTGNAILNRLFYQLDIFKNNSTLPPLSDLLAHRFYKNDVVVISFQRKNRNYPGRVVVRDTNGVFLKDSTGLFFSVPQLARSITNLPGYISLGNTPQGIFRMWGTAISKNGFIGPTPNLQLTLPAETNINHFLNDSTISDTTWHPKYYQQLLPQSWKNYMPFFESYYAGMAGRNEIIAHGTTINPEWYSNMPCYPLTPSLGCLCTTELWSPANGSRVLSDQQNLTSHVQKAGGANGYLLVVELNDKQEAVSADEVQQLLNQRQ
jgi:hypothetical protein